MDKLLWEAANSIRGPVSQEEFFTLALSVGVIQKSNHLKIKELLQSNNFATNQFIEVLKESAKSLNISIPYTIENTQRIVEKMKTNKLNDFLFKLFELFKQVSIQEFSKEINVNNVIDGKKAEHNSSLEINELSLKILNITPNDTFLDPSCGYGNAILSILEKNSEQKIFGQEINPVIAELARIRATLLGAVNVEIAVGDVLENPQYVEDGVLQRFDRIYSESPIGLRKQKLEKMENDPYNRFMYGLPPKSRMDWAFISNGISSLNENGKAVFLTSLGPLFRSAMEQRIRRKIIELDLVEAVIALPSNLLEYSSISTALLVINKNKDISRKGKVLMIDAENIFTGRKKRTLSNDDIEEIYELYSSGLEIQKKSKYISLNELEEANLLPSKYIIDDELETNTFGKIKFDLERVKELKTVEIGKIAEINPGYNVVGKDEDKNGDYSFIKISDVEDGVIYYDKLTKGNVRKNTKVEKYRVRKGDLLISVRGTDIKYAVINEDVSDVLFTQNFNSIRPSDLVDAYWLKLYLESPLGEFELNSISSGSNVTILKTSEISNIKIPVIDIEKQKEIVTDYYKKMNEYQKQLQLIEEKKRNLKLQVYSNMGLEETFKIVENKKED